MTNQDTKTGGKRNFRRNKQRGGDETEDIEEEFRGGKRSTQKNKQRGGEELDEEEFSGGKKDEEEQFRGGKRNTRRNKQRGGDCAKNEQELLGGKRKNKRNTRRNKQGGGVTLDVDGTFTVNQRAGGKKKKMKKGGKKAGILETATVPFGLFAIQHLYSRGKKKVLTRKNKKFKKGKFY